MRIGGRICTNRLLIESAGVLRILAGRSMAEHWMFCRSAVQAIQKDQVTCRLRILRSVHPAPERAGPPIRKERLGSRYYDIEPPALPLGYRVQLHKREIMVGSRSAADPSPLTWSIRHTLSCPLRKRRPRLLLDLQPTNRPAAVDRTKRCP